MKSNASFVGMRAVVKLLFKSIPIEAAYPKLSNGLLIWPSMAVEFVIRPGYLISVPTPS
jgi:hypothetical protein